MSEDIYNALAGMTDELMAARRSWVVLPSGTRINLANVLNTEHGQDYYRNDAPCLFVYGTGYTSGEIGGGWLKVYGDDIDAMLAAIDARQVQR